MRKANLKEFVGVPLGGNIMFSRRRAMHAGLIFFCLIGGLLLIKWIERVHTEIPVRETVETSKTAREQSIPKPISGMDHAKLANYYIAQRKGEQALDELRQAERLGSTNGFEFQASLFQGYCNLHEVKAAIRHGLRCIALGKSSGVKSETIDSIQWWCDNFKARSVPAYVEVVSPKPYTPQEFNEAVRQRLSPGQADTVVNPLATSAEIALWAAKLVAGAKDDGEKAQMLFEGVTHRLDGSTMQPLTAEQVCKNWNNQDFSFHCQEYAFLYASLARAAGLNAFVVVVRETCYGEKAEHACAAVLFGKRALLVDPSYFWFGVPHKQFIVLDDIQAAALYLSTFVDLKKARIACKLAPALLEARNDLFCSLVRQGEWSEAEAVLPQLQEQDSDGWAVSCDKAVIAYHEQKYNEAVSQSRKAVEINPSCGTAYLYLGASLEKLDRFTDAREALQRGSSCPLDVDTADQIQKRMQWLAQSNK